MRVVRESGRHHQGASFVRNARSVIFLLCGLIVSIAIFTIALRRPDFTQTTGDPYAAVPFRPRVTYNLPDVSVMNTETESYLETRLTIYVGANTYRVWVGNLAPGETATRRLRDFTGERGDSFNLATQKADLLEVRARMGGYEVHKDIPPPR